MNKIIVSALLLITFGSFKVMDTEPNAENPAQQSTPVVRINYLDQETFSNITINGIKTKEIRDLKDDPAHLQSMFGPQMERKEYIYPYVEPSLAYTNSTYVLSFIDWTETRNEYELMSLSVVGPGAEVVIDGFPVRVGDTHYDIYDHFDGSHVITGNQIEYYITIQVENPPGIEDIMIRFGRANGHRVVTEIEYTAQSF